MKQDLQPAPNPRKRPQQQRSEKTIEAIFTASIQVLRVEGPSGFTTTRVAERAGVSVGTLYQYFSNNQSLLYAVLSRHLGRVALAVEIACRELEGKPLTTIADGLVHAYLYAFGEDPSGLPEPC